MKQFLISILVLFFSTSTCNAQGFAKAARSVSKCIGANKAIIGANAVRGYSIQEKQRRQIAQNVAHQTLQSTSHLNSVAVTNARCSAANKTSALLASPRLHDVTKLPKGILQNDSILIPILPTMPTDTTSVVNENNHK